MGKKLFFALLAAFLIFLFVSGLLFYFSDQIAMLSPKGLIALKERNLMLLATLLMLIVVVPVFALTIYVCIKYKATNKDSDYRPDWNHSLLAESIWWGFPLLIVTVLSIVAYTSSHRLDPYRPLEGGQKPVNIQVVALDWKWLFIYPEEKIATVNFFQFPAHTPLNFDITADAPMNSFWIPELGGQIYAMPAMKTKLHLIAEKEGQYRGSSANISGIGFSGMVFTAKASSEEEYKSWVQKIQQSAPKLGIQEYLKLAKPSSYDPPSFYVLEEPALFDFIAMKGMETSQEQEDKK